MIKGYVKTIYIAHAFKLFTQHLKADTTTSHDIKFETFSMVKIKKLENSKVIRIPTIQFSKNASSPTPKS